MKIDAPNQYLHHHKSVSLCSPSGADPCYPNPCSNNGRCLSNSDGDKFMCECALGYLGESCKGEWCQRLE